jgi:hypothetical protein
MAERTPIVERSLMDRRTVKQILEHFLINRGFDGLFNPDGECACEIAELFPCGESFSDCEPGYKVPCDCGDHDFHISRERS